MTTTVTPLAFDHRIAELLEECALPSEDLGADSKSLLYGIESGRAVIGLVGLELYGTVALLRSLAVSPRHQRTGMGGQLLRHAEGVAAEHGIDSLYLLTTTAEHYFHSHGYVPADRQDAPAAIVGTRQFTGLCPASAAFLVKRHVAHASANRQSP